MTELKATPGPWLIEDFADSLPGGRSPSGEDPISIYVPGGYGRKIVAGVDAYDEEEGQANAALIAAAPELYAALEEALEWASDAHRPRGPLINALRAALSKARGEA